jgi:hypothetical protein
MHGQTMHDHMNVKHLNVITFTANLSHEIYRIPYYCFHKLTSILRHFLKWKSQRTKKSLSFVAV